jgi:predicted metal-binding protein
MVSVCTTCKTVEGVPVGAPMLDAVKAALAGAAGVQVRAVQCLSVCKRAASVAVSSTDGYTFIFGDLTTDSGADAVAAFVALYQDSDYGLVPWRQRPEVLRKGTVARLPPPSWSPDDGRPPS